MASLGIWLWSDPRSFGPGDSCVVDIARIAILGRSVPLGSAGLRGWSIAIYSFFLAPGLNLVLPVALFLGSFLGYQTWNTRRLSKNAALGTPAVPSVDRDPSRIRSAIRAWYNRLPVTPSIFPTVVGMALLFATNLIFLVDIELTLRRNRTHQTAGESEWTFGQILAILLLVLPLRDLIETMLARRETKRQDELAQRDKQRRDEHAATLRNAIQEKVTMKAIMDLVEKGADVNMKVEDCDYPTALMLAAARGDAGSVAGLLERGAAPNIKGGKDGSALISACRNGHGEAAKLLLQHGADPNAQGGHGAAFSVFSWKEHPEVAHILFEHGPEEMDLSGLNVRMDHGRYGTALQAASYWGYIVLVELILARGVDINAQGGDYGTALQAASLRGNIAVVELLVARGADVNIQGGEYGTALQAASTCGDTAWRIPQVHVAIAQLLLARGADVNIQGGKYWTALHAASYRGRVAVVELLIARGADVNTQGGEYGTALQAASSAGNVTVVELLLGRGADANIQGGYHGTALQAASRGGHFALVELLLARNADVNMQGDQDCGQYGTALRAAALSGWIVNLNLKIKIIQLLLSHGADPNLAADNEYGSILNEAQKCNELLELLRAHGAV